MNLILPVLLLYADAVIHELGHLLAARWAGIRVFEVSIGQGPLLFSLEGPHTGTLYTFRLLPWDGYTAMLMLPDGCRRRALRRSSLCAQGILTQALVLSAGFLAESIAALVFFAFWLGHVGGSLNPSWTFGTCLFGFSAIANMLPFGQSDGARLHNLAQFGCIFHRPRHTSRPPVHRRTRGSRFCAAGRLFDGKKSATIPEERIE